MGSLLSFVGKLSERIPLTYFFVTILQKEVYTNMKIASFIFGVITGKITCQNTNIFCQQVNLFPLCLVAVHFGQRSQGAMELLKSFTIETHLKKFHLMTIKNTSRKKSFRREKRANPNCRRLGFASGYAARFFKFHVLQRMVRVKNAERLNKPLVATFCSQKPIITKWFGMEALSVILGRRIPFDNL